MGRCQKERMMLDLSAAFATFPVLTTERLILRAVTPADAVPIFRIMSSPRVMRYFGSPPMQSIEEAHRRVEAIEEDFREQLGIRWAITLRSGGAFIGSGGFWRIVKPHYRAEVGYELAPEWWGKGIMPEALSAILGCGFTTLGLNSIEAQIAPANSGSRRVLEKLGFEQEGYFRQNYYEPETGEFTDTAVFGLPRSDWLRRQAGM
jgi:[ribosomal protein S5]-alanine N-acetyltransferase